jgi:hypothetical protein
MTFTAIGDTLSDNFLTISQHRVSKKIGGKNEKDRFFFTYDSPGSLKTLNRLCSNNSTFQVDRGVSEGFSVELGRDRTQSHLVRKR